MTEAMWFVIAVGAVIFLNFYLLWMLRQSVRSLEKRVGYLEQLEGKK